MNTSATGGYLRPTSPAPAEDDGLEDQLQAIIVGITGLDGTLVRPRWQSTPPKQPPAASNWCAIGVTRNNPDTYGVVIHNAAGEGSDTLQRHETIEALASFYGPAAQGYATLFSDGLLIAQNREQMAANNLALYEARPVTAAPDLTNTQWIRRYDVPFTLRRQVNRTYAVLNILSSDGIIKTPETTQAWHVEE